MYMQNTQDINTFMSSAIHYTIKNNIGIDEKTFFDTIKSYNKILQKYPHVLLETIFNFITQNNDVELHDIINIFIPSNLKGNLMIKNNNGQVMIKTSGNKEHVLFKHLSKYLKKIDDSKSTKKIYLLPCVLNLYGPNNLQNKKKHANLLLVDNINKFIYRIDPLYSNSIDFIDKVFHDGISKVIENKFKYKGVLGSVCNNKSLHNIFLIQKFLQEGEEYCMICTLFISYYFSKIDFTNINIETLKNNNVSNIFKLAQINDIHVMRLNFALFMEQILNIFLSIAPNNKFANIKTIANFQIPTNRKISILKNKYITSNMKSQVKNQLKNTMV